MDINGEYHVVLRVLSTAQWHPYNSPYYYSSLLSVTLLPSMMFIVSGISTQLSFKLLFTTISAFISLLIFHIYRKHFNRTIAIISSLIFLTQKSFFNIVLNAGRQVVAFFLLSLFTNILFKDTNINFNKIVLIILLIAGIVFSHYTVNLLLLLFFVIVSLLSFRFDRKIYSQAISIIIISIMITFLYYFLTTPIGNFIATVVIRVQLELKEIPEPINIMGNALEIKYFSKMLNIIILFFISIGILRIIITRELNMLNIYIISAYLVLLFDYFIGPYYGYGRFFQQFLMLLAPMFSYGLITFLKLFKREYLFPVFVSVIVIAQLLAVTSVIEPASYLLVNKRSDIYLHLNVLSSEVNTIMFMDIFLPDKGNFTVITDFFGTGRIVSNVKKITPIFLNLGNYSYRNIIIIDNFETIKWIKNKIIFLRYENIMYNRIAKGWFTYESIELYLNYLNNNNLIYTSGASELFCDI
jgi:uncharacterized membrane protein